MSLEKLVHIRQRLAQLTEPDGDAIKSARELKNEQAIQGAIQALDEVIGSYKSEWLINTNLERELQRTTSQPLEAPKQPGPHEVTWKPLEPLEPPKQPEAHQVSWKANGFTA